MKRTACILLISMVACMLAACNNNIPTVVTSESESSVTSEINTESEESDSPNQESDNMTLSIAELSQIYADYIDQIANECDMPEDIVFTTADVNNDGIRELLYAESSVNAAGVYVCFCDNGNIVKAGPFGCYGNIKYAPKEGKIISVSDNMDYMTYELVTIDGNYETSVEHKYAIEPNFDAEGYVYFLDDEEVTSDAYADAFKTLQNMNVKALDYNDMYMYTWCNGQSDPIGRRLELMLTDGEPSRDYHMFIPMVEKAKLIGTWKLYSSEIEGDVSFAETGAISGKITVHEDYTVDLDYGRHQMSGMMMEFYHGSFNDYADNTDWYVVIDATEEDETIIYMNVSDEDILTVNTIGDGENLLSLWDTYKRAN